MADIKPSKPQVMNERTEPIQKVSSIVQVNPATETKLLSKVEVKSSPALVASKAEPPIIISKVQVIEEVKPSVQQSNVIAKVVTESPVSILLTATRVKK